MDNLPLHMRITGLAVSNDDVNSRRAAATKLAGTWGKIRDVGQILTKAADIAQALGGDGAPPSALAAEVEGVVQKHASAFLASERPLEVGVCAGVAAISVISPVPGRLGWSIVDVYAATLWLSLSFQPTLTDEKRENLRVEVLNLARDQTLKSAETARERDVVPDPTELTVTLGEDGESVTIDFKDALAKTVDALRRNAVLDREELNFLWWAQLGRSRLLNRPLSAIPEPLRLVAAGIEGACYLRRLPAEVHRDLVLRTVDTDPQLTLVELLEVIGPEREVLAGNVPPGLWTSAPTVFPLLTALATGAASGPGAAESRNASAWGARALLEAGLARMMANGIIKL